MSIKGEGRKLFPEGCVLFQDVLFGDDLRFPGWFASISATEDEDFVGIENRIVIFIEDDKLVAVFLFDLFAEFPDAGLLSSLFPFVLLIHPGSKDCGEGHGDAVYNGRFIFAFPDASLLFPGLPDALLCQRQGVFINVHVGLGRDVEDNAVFVEPPKKLAVHKSSIHGQRNDLGMASQIGDGLFNHFTGQVGLGRLYGGKAHGQRQAAVRVPHHPNLKTEDGFKHFSYSSLAKPQCRGFVLGHLAASFTPLGGFDFGGIQKGVDSLGKIGMLRQDPHHAIENPLQGLPANGLDERGNGIRANGTADVSGLILFIRLVGFVARRFFLPPVAGAFSDPSAVKTQQPHQGLRAKDHRMDMPKEVQPRNNTHQVDEVEFLVQNTR
jgi:hypothetical protein